MVLKELITTQRYWNDKIDAGVGKEIDIDEMKIFTTPDTRAKIYKVIGAGKWLALVDERKEDGVHKEWKIIDSIIPPHQGEVPKKDSNEMRTVYILENFDRVFSSIYNDYLFEKCADMIHPQCKSYLKGVGTGKVDQELTKQIVKIASKCNGRVIAYKTDMVHYFDTCPIEEIDKVYDKIRQRTGESAVHDIYQKLHHTNKCFDMDNKLIDHFFSIGQGIAIASFFADAILYDVDKYISENFDVYYIRFSDDILIVGNECEQAFAKLTEMLQERGLALNPKKTEAITQKEYFKFLGFAIRGNDITISKTRLKDFKDKIEKIAFTFDGIKVKEFKDEKDVIYFQAVKYKYSYNHKTKKTQKTILHKVGKKYSSKKECVEQLNYMRFKRVLRGVIEFLYYGNGEYCWATSMLSIINVDVDIETMDKWLLDVFRAVLTGHYDIGGLGYEKNKKNGVVTRAPGQNVTENKKKTPKEIKVWVNLMAMRDALRAGKDVFDAFVNTMFLELENL